MMLWNKLAKSYVLGNTVTILNNTTSWQTAEAGVKTRRTDTKFRFSTGSQFLCMFPQQTTSSKLVC